MRSYSVNVEPRGGFWQARVYLEGEGGKSRRFSTGVPLGDNRALSKRAAKNAAEERAKELAREAPLVKGTLRGGKNSLEAVAKRMIAQKETSKRRSRAIDALEFNLDKHVFPFFGETTDVTTIRRAKVEEFRTAMAKKYKGVSTTNNALTTIRQVLKYACHVDESIEAVPVVANLPTDNRGTGMPITIEQAELFLASFAEDEIEEREYHEFLFNTGLRKFETLAMCWDWIDWEARVIRIPGEFRKGGKEQRVPTTMTAEVYRLLRARQKRERQPKHGRVWFQLKGGRKGGRDYDRARARAAAKSGIAGFRGHDARHTRASILAANGATEMDLRDAMNWETTAMANRYTHPTHDRVKRLAATVQISKRPSHASPSRGRKKSPPPTGA